MRIKSIFMWAIMALIFFTCVFDQAEAKKAKKRKTKKVKKEKNEQIKKRPAPQKSSKKKPDSVSAELYCNACQAIVKESIKRLKHRKSEAAVFDVLSDACDPKYYYIYMFPPPEMKDGCTAFIMDWEEDLEKVLLERETNAEVEQKICYEISEACKNVDPEKDTPKMPEEIWVDGQPKPVKNGVADLSADGSEEVDKEL